MKFLKPQKPRHNQEVIIAFTYFFRDNQTLSAAVKKLIPKSIGYKEIKIWDAGCANGAEPFSLAILLAENLSKFAFNNVKIHATDIDRNNQYKNIISEGNYSYEKLKRIPDEIFKKYFIKTDHNRHYKIIEEIRNKVHFRKHDLLTYRSIGKAYSMIICKNVLLHFKPSERVKVIETFYESLGFEGLLVFEQTQKLPKDISSLFNKVTDNNRIFRKADYNYQKTKM